MNPQANTLERQLRRPREDRPARTVGEARRFDTDTVEGDDDLSESARRESAELWGKIAKSFS